MPTLRTVSRNSLPYAELYAMSPRPLPTLDTLDAEPLLTPDEFRALSAQIQRNANRLIKVNWVTIIIDVLILGTNLLWCWRHGNKNFGAFVAPVMCINLLSRMIAARIGREDRRVANRLIGFMKNTCDVRQLGSIVDLYSTTERLGMEWPKVQEATRRAARRLLPLIQSDDADTLNTQQRARLRYDLFKHTITMDRRYWRGSVYCLPLLSALEQIGDKRDLPDVERLLKADYLTDPIRTAAERCAQTIRERIARENDKDVLLRADRKPEAVETLLRPSIASADTPPQQLLRAATHDDGNTPD